MREFNRIITNPNVANGLPCIRDTGITVSEVVKKITYEKLMDEVLELYPMLEYEDLVDALAYQIESYRGLVLATMHDLRSPLSTIIGMSEILTSQPEKLNDDARQNLLSTIHDNGNRLLDSAEVLAQWASLQATTPNIISISLIEIIRQFHMSRVVLKYEGPQTELLRIRGDAWQIPTAFNLLAKNSMWGQLSVDCVIEIRTTSANSVNFKIQRWFIKPIDFKIFKADISYPANAISTSILILRNHNSDLQISSIDNGVLFEFNLLKQGEI